MRLLLDTHALLWAIGDPARLSAAARAALEDPTNELRVSAVSAWEIATKTRIGELAGGERIVAAFPEHLERLRAIEAPISSRAALLAGSLPWTHRDPFDRLLAAQSALLAAPLVTMDRAFADSAVLTCW